MSELDLYKFINTHELEIDWRGDALILWIDHYLIDDFTDLCRSYIECDCGIYVHLQENFIALDISYMCDFYGFEPENICERDN